MKIQALLLLCFPLHFVEAQEATLVKYRLIRPDLHRSYDHCEEKVLSDFGISYVAPDTGLTELSIKKHNRRVDRLLRRRYGKDWDLQLQRSLGHCQLADWEAVIRTNYRSLTDNIWEVGDKIIAPRVRIDHNGHITEDGLDSLKLVAQWLADHSNLRVEIGMHTDIRGDEEYNLKFSEYNVMKIGKALEFKLGIPADRFSTKGYGESQPIISLEEIETAPYYAEEMHLRNRRVELTIMSK